MVSQGGTAGVASVVTNTKVVHYQINGVTTEGTLTVSLAAGALTDAFGNPGAAFSASYAVDIGTVPFPTLSPKAPFGSLIYDATAAGIIGTAGDTDSFTINVDPGQTVTVLVT